MPLHFFEGRRIHRDNLKEVIVLMMEAFVLVSQPRIEKNDGLKRINPSSEFSF